MLRKTDEFDLDNKYKLYRNLYEVIHPTISKRNISEYKIILKDDLVPIRVFYPKKISLLSSMIIYIHGDEYITGGNHSYSYICQELAEKTNTLVIAIDYNSDNNIKLEKVIKNCYNIILYLYKNIEQFNISTKNIVLMGDSIGSALAIAVANKINKEDKKIKKVVLLYPILTSKINTGEKKLSKKANKYLNEINSSEKDSTIKEIFPLDSKKIVNNIPDILILTANMDCFKIDGYEYYQNLDKNKCKYLNYEFVTHGFLSIKENEIKTKVYEEIKLFLSK